MRNFLVKSPDFLKNHRATKKNVSTHCVEAAQHTAGHKDGRTTARYFHGTNEIARRVAVSRNKPVAVKSTVKEIKPVPSAKSKSKDSVIAELLQQNQQLLEMLVQKDKRS